MRNPLQWLSDLRRRRRILAMRGREQTEAVTAACMAAIAAGDVERAAWFYDLAYDPLGVIILLGRNDVHSSSIDAVVERCTRREYVYPGSTLDVPQTMRETIGRPLPRRKGNEPV